MSDFRNIMGRNGAPVQQSMTTDDQYYGGRQMTTVMFGIVLSVFQSDDPNNEAAIRSAGQHGFIHQCSVLVVNDGYGSNTILPKVYILPDQVSGIDDYYEMLPKGCVKTLSGQPFNSNLIGLDPEDLDGERCLVSFIGGNIDQPFILKWFPHSKNTFDPLTTGEGFQDQEGIPRALDQSGRKFVRSNGVEYVITKAGDIYLNTNFTNSIISPEKTSTFGRFGRTLNPQSGGSIKINVKPSQMMMIDFNDYRDGVGTVGFDPALPQTNPKPDNYGNNVFLGNTNVVMDKDTFKVSSPESIDLYGGNDFNITTNKSISIRAGTGGSLNFGGSTTIDTNGDFSTFVDGNSLNVVGGNSLEQITGETHTLAIGNVTSTLRGKATGEIDGDFFLQLKGKVNILSNDIINLASSADLDENSNLLRKEFSTDTALVTAKTALDGLPPASSLATTAALANALKTALDALISALENTTTNTTRAL